MEMVAERTTDWQFGRLTDRLIVRLILIKSPILLDLRNLYEPAALKFLGFIYEGVGRK